MDDVGVEADDDDDSEWPLFTAAAAAATPDTEAADDWLAFGSMLLPKLTDSKSYKHGYGNLNSHPRL